jgi:hypothetical protein
LLYSEPVFVNVSGAQESIPPAYVAWSRRYVKKGCRTSPPGWESISGLLKDIVQPKKRGVKRGMNRFVSTSYTIADVFFEHLKG